MNARAVSLPDLAADVRRGKPLSLSEGFIGANRSATLASTSLNFAPRLTASVQHVPYSGDDGTIPTRLNAVLPIYYRTRQMVLEQEKKGLRAPQRLVAELRAQEKAVGNELRPLHPLLFQRFDDVQLDRLLRSMAILKLSPGRWVFGSEGLAEPWPTHDGDRSFLLLYGRVTLFADPSGSGDREEITRGAIFSEARRFRICDETIRDKTCGAAYCEEPCIVGCLSSKVMQTAFADRAMGNKMVAQQIKNIACFARIVQPEQAFDIKPKDNSLSAEEAKKKKEAAEAASGAILFGLRDLSKIATVLHVRPGQEVLMEESSDESLLIVQKGGLDIKGDVRLVERLEALPPKKVRVRVFVDRAEKLAGDSWMDKLDPYCIVKMGEIKRFQTPVLWNVGPNPKFEYKGCLTYAGEEGLEITCMDHDTFSSDDLCGSGFLPLANIPDGWSGKVPLTRPKEGFFGGDDDQELEEPAGHVFVTIHYDFEKINSLMKTPKERSWNSVNVFNVKKGDVWGHEQLMLNHMFRRTLEQSSSMLAYRLHLGQLRIFAASPRGEQETTVLWKINRKRFLDFTKHCGREKQFTQHCRVDALAKQTAVKDMLTKLIRRWEQENLAAFIRSSAFMSGDNMEESMEPSMFKVAYKGTNCNITVRNALNLAGGSFWDKLDPYAKVKFKNSREPEFQTNILQDAGSDPVWDNEGSIKYNGENTLEIKVYDYDKYSADDLVAEGVIQIEKFGQINGFEGTVPLSLPGNKKKKSLKQMLIIIGIVWDQPKEPNAGKTGDSALGDSTTGAQKLMNSTR